MKRKVYHITKNRKGYWQSKVRENKNPSIIALSKKEVIEKTVKLAKKSSLSQVIIHKEDGEIQSERTYGKDPRKSKG